MTETVTGQLIDPGFRTQFAEPMFRLRHEVFHDRLGWEVESHNGLEFDRFDDGDTVYQIVTQQNRVTGCWRLRPTTRPCMLDKVFPDLVEGSLPEPGSDTWEISRFTTTNSAYINARAGFGESAVALMGAALEYAETHDIARYLMVTSVPLERIGRRLGVPTRRMGRPRRIGTVTAVALELELDVACRRRIRSLQQMLSAARAA